MCSCMMVIFSVFGLIGFFIVRILLVMFGIAVGEMVVGAFVIMVRGVRFWLVIVIRDRNNL